MRAVLAGLCLAAAFVLGVANAAQPPRVEVRTNMGAFVIELYPDYAPQTVANFLAYVNEGFYDNTLFHRLVRNFLLQGGAYSRDMTPKRATHPPVRNEGNHRISNERYTVAMARDADADSATSQFFVNLADNYTLDFEAPTPTGWGYCVFGRVTQGREAIDAMAAVEIMTGGDFIGDTPMKEIVLQTARVLPPADN